MRLRLKSAETTTTALSMHRRMRWNLHA